MKRFVMLFSVVVVLAFAALAFAQQFSNFSVDVPKDWTPSEEDGVVYMQSDIDETFWVLIDIGDKDGTSLEDIANYYNEQWGGDGLLDSIYEDEGFYMFETNDLFETPATVYIGDKASVSGLGDGEYGVLAAGVNVPTNIIEDILDSLKSNNASSSDDDDDSNCNAGAGSVLVLASLLAFRKKGR